MWIDCFIYICTSSQIKCTRRRTITMMNGSLFLKCTFEGRCIKNRHHARECQRLRDFEDDYWEFCHLQNGLLRQNVKNKKCFCRNIDVQLEK